MKKLSIMLILSVSMLILTFLGTGKIDKLAINVLIGLCMIISYKLGEQRGEMLGEKRGAMLGAILGARRAIEKICGEEMQK